MISENKKRTLFGLLRHGKTEWNLKRKIQGWKDSPLTEAGRKTIRRWGLVLENHRWDRIISSDMARAVETATIINTILHIPMTQDQRLREQDWGQWTGMTLQEIKKEAPALYAEQENAAWAFCPPGGEDRYSVLERSLRALEEAAKKWRGECVLVITHEGVIKCLVSHVIEKADVPVNTGRFRSDRLHLLVYTDSGLHLKEMNAIAPEDNF